MPANDRLTRFAAAQDSPDAGFESALREIRGGRKSGHWIWYVLPQLSGLGASEMSRTFALRDAGDAADYVCDPVLGPRLLAIVSAIDEQLATHPGLSVASLMGSEIDARKLVSSLTLFEPVARSLDEAGAPEWARALGETSRAVLERAAAEGYPPCAYTRGRLEAGATPSSS
ncbi:MAG TPA: DUF1810 family protein [Vicinamibacterales bacterium]|nr:DUF1810 family protein [Vicinamibacterales bacterium]